MRPRTTEMASLNTQNFVTVKKGKKMPNPKSSSAPASNAGTPKRRTRFRNGDLDSAGAGGMASNKAGPIADSSHDVGGGGEVVGGTGAARQRPYETVLFGP